MDGKAIATAVEEGSGPAMELFQRLMPEAVQPMREGLKHISSETMIGEHVARFADLGDHTTLAALSHRADGTITMVDMIGGDKTHRLAIDFGNGAGAVVNEKGVHILTREKANLVGDLQSVTARMPSGNTLGFKMGERFPLAFQNDTPITSKFWVRDDHARFDSENGTITLNANANPFVTNSGEAQLWLRHPTGSSINFSLGQSFKTSFRADVSDDAITSELDFGSVYKSSSIRPQFQFDTHNGLHLSSEMGVYPADVLARANLRIG